jgi:hypothetical protein
MTAADGGATSDQKEIPAAVILDNAAIPHGRKYRPGVGRRQRQVAGEAEGRIPAMIPGAQTTPVQANRWI